MGVVVNWFLLMIIFVFDPLAIALVVAANMAFAQIRKPEDDPAEDYFQSRNKELEKVVMSVPEGMEFNKPYPMPAEWTEPSPELKQRVEENQNKIKLEKKDLVVNDLEDMPFEEEKWLPEVEEEDENKVILESELEEEIHEGKQMAKGFDTMLQVMEEEEKEKEKEQEDITTGIDDPSAHELYHGGEDSASKAYSDNDKRRSRKSKPVKRIRRTPPRYGSGPVKQRRKK